MIFGAISFNQPIGDWNVSNVINMENMFFGTALSTLNYDHLLLSWEQLPLQPNVNFHVGYSKYSIAAAYSREYIITNFYWSITDGGLILFPPSVPQSLQANEGDDQVNLAWSVPVSDGGSEITNYNIYRSTTNGSGYVLLTTVNGTTLIYTDYTVTNGQDYYYIVKAVNNVGESDASKEVVVTPISIPSAPHSLQANAKGSQVSLSWSAPVSSVITNYNIYRSTTSGSGYVLLTTVNSTTLTYIDTTVTNGQNYYYIVKAVNNVGESDASNKVLVLCPSVPSAPQSLQANAGDNQVSLFWSTPISDGGSTITGYNIYRSTTSGTGYVLLTTVNSTTLTYTDNTVTNGQNYYYFVKAVNNVGESDASNETQATTEKIVYTSGFEICSLIGLFSIILVKSIIKKRNMREF